VNRQRGWSTDGSTWQGCGLGAGRGLPRDTLRRATHLVMELAGQPSSSASRTVQVNILTNTLFWSQAEPRLNSEHSGMNPVWNPNVGPFGALVFDLANLVFTEGPDAFAALQTMTQGRILIGYYSYGWEELNLMRAYLVLQGGQVVSVLETDRVIPDPKDPNDDAAVVAPVVVTAGEFTLGPNPADRRSDGVSFYWSGRAIKGGRLFVYDASGNVVNRINVGANNYLPLHPASAKRRQIGTWDLRDRRGRPVSDGTYLVRGTLVGIDGKRERVSVMVGVR